MNAKGFSCRFEATYGPGAIEKFKQLMERGNPLGYGGRYIGFSKQYAHRIFPKIYGYPYSRLAQKKQQARSCG